MATVTPFDKLTEDLAKGVHNFDSHVFKLVLTNTAPVVGNTVLANITQITAANGYTAGGLTVPNTDVTRTDDVTQFVGDGVEWTAESGGGIGPFRYWVLYNDTASGDPLVCFWDNGASITIPATTSFRVRFNGLDTAGKIFDIAGAA